MKRFALLLSLLTVCAAAFPASKNDSGQKVELQHAHGDSGMERYREL